MKQTAVEWLIEQVKSHKYIEDVDFEQAKEMEEEQITDAYLRGIENLKQLLKDKENDSSRMVRR
jgi:hypothetical protein